MVQGFQYHTFYRRKKKVFLIFMQICILSSNKEWTLLILASELWKLYFVVSITITITMPVISNILQPSKPSHAQKC